MSDFDAIDEEPSAPRDVILCTDATEEGIVLAEELRIKGYAVFSVRLSELGGLVLDESPRVVIVDVDEAGAVERAERLRELPGSAPFQLLLIGDPLRAAELGLTRDHANVFSRPTDYQAVSERVETVLATPRFEPLRHGTAPPPSFPPSRETVGPDRRESDVPPISDLPPMPTDDTSTAFGGPDDAIGPIPTGPSPELEKLLAEAEAKLDLPTSSHSSVPAPREGRGPALPPDLLAALDEPLDPDGDSVAPMPPLGVPSISAEPGSVAGISLNTNADADRPAGTETSASLGRITARGIASGLVPPTTNAGVSIPSSPGSPRAELLAGPPTDDEPEQTGAGVPSETSAGTEVPKTGQHDFEPYGEGVALPRHEPGRPTALPPTFQSDHANLAEPLEAVAAALAPSTPRAAPQTAPYGEMAAPRRDFAPREADIAAAEPTDRGAPRDLPEVFDAGQEADVVGLAIAQRRTGVLVLGSSRGSRQLVLQDGDIVTAASDVEDETLLEFLAGRGDIDRAFADRQATKMPRSGRHAGAALIANGYLGQDDLWPVLRGHAEWIIGRVLTGGPGRVSIDEELPPRLRAEPNVFGGATGAEVFVETVRRVIPPEAALARLGGDDTRLHPGPFPSLLGECALSTGIAERFRAVAGSTLGELLPQLAPLDTAHAEIDDLPDPGYQSLAYALSALGVLRLESSASRSESALAEDGPDPLDEDAIRHRVAARMALIEEGDYFQVLGIQRNATAYEVRRAFLELKRIFHPGQLLTAQTADLLDDCNVIVEVLEEAYEILRDQRRKERYRRAIEAGPPV